MKIIIEMSEQEYQDFMEYKKDKRYIINKVKSTREFIRNRLEGPIYAGSLSRIFEDLVKDLEAK